MAKCGNGVLLKMVKYFAALLNTFEPTCGLKVKTFYS